MRKDGSTATNHVCCLLGGCSVFRSAWHLGFYGTGPQQDNKRSTVPEEFSEVGGSMLAICAWVQPLFGRLAKAT